MIKLKSLIIEILNNKILSKMEEEFALKVIILKLLPDVVKDFNNWIDTKIKHQSSKRPLPFSSVKKKFKKVNYQDLIKNIKKIERESDRATYEIILQNGHVIFIIQKDIDFLSNKENVYIRYFPPVDVGWTVYERMSYNLEDLLNKNN